MGKGPPSLFHPKKRKPGLPLKKDSSNPTPSGSGSASASPNPSQSVLPTSQPSQPQTAPSTPAATPSTPSRPRIVRRPPEDEKPAAPTGPYSEYRLLSSKLNGWKYDVMKFESRKKVDIAEWAQPVKLNRKDPHRADAGAGAAQVAVGPMVASDGQLVVGPDGKVVMVDALGRPVRAPAAAEGDGKEKEAGKGGKDVKGKKRFQKKTRQVYLVPDDVRQLRREERFPWVMEDGTQQETWVGAMEEVAKSQTFAMFMPAANDVFKFVPAHRWYKFQKKPHYRVPNLEEAESLMTKMQKNKDSATWALRPKLEPGAEGSAGSLVHNAGQSLGPGGRRLKAVDSGDGGLFGDDDEEGMDHKRRVKRELGQEGFLDEVDYEEGFADDEEKMEVDDQEDEETKELEERLKREYKTANKTREGYIDESDDEEDETKLTGAGKNLQKTLKKLEKEGGYDDSDDEKNPYASSEEEEEEEPQPVQTGPAILPPEPRPGSRAGVGSQQIGANGSTKAVNGAPYGKSEGSQSPSAPGASPGGHGGHSVVAKRATSPKVPKVKTGIASRGGSPLPVLNGVTSPPGSRATSPGAGAGSVPGTAHSTSPTSARPVKRKAADEAQPAGNGVAVNGVGRPKKRRAQAPPGAENIELEQSMVIGWLKNTPNATTRDCILHFTPYLNTPEKKTRFTDMVKLVAQLHNGVLVLREAYQGEAGL